MRLREDNVNDAVFNLVKGASTVSQASPRTNQLDESSVVNSELTVIQVSREPAQRQGPGAAVRNTLATKVTITNSKSMNVVLQRVTHTRRIVKRIKVSSKGSRKGRIRPLVLNAKSDLPHFAISLCRLLPQLVAASAAHPRHTPYAATPAGRGWAWPV